MQTIEHITKPWREIVYPTGKTISQVNRYLYKKGGYISMQIYKDFFTIKDTDCISEIDSSLPSLLGTYTLVKWMEIISAKLANKNISDNLLTVGQDVCIEHKGMGKIGQKVKITSKMIETSKRSMKFNILATIDDKLIANAKHTRIIISKKVIDRQLQK